jgi:hypothetical protein
MYETIMEQIPTTIKHEERLTEINRLLIDSGIGQLPSLAAFARIRAAREAEMIATLRSKYQTVVRYTMLADERIAERLSYLAMDIESEFHTTTTPAGVIVLTWDTFPDAYSNRMTEYIADIAGLEYQPSEFEAMMDAADVAYDNANN